MRYLNVLYTHRRMQLLGWAVLGLSAAAVFAQNDDYSGADSAHLNLAAVALAMAVAGLSA